MRLAIYMKILTIKISTSVTKHYTWTYCSKLFAVAHLQWKLTFKKQNLLPFEKEKIRQIFQKISKHSLWISDPFIISQCSWNQCQNQNYFLYFYCLPLTNSIYSANVFDEGWLNGQNLETLLNRRCKYWGAMYKKSI